MLTQNRGDRKTLPRIRRDGATNGSVWPYGVDAVVERAAIWQYDVSVTTDALPVIVAALLPRPHRSPTPSA
jgi:hypothetical protein